MIEFDELKSEKDAKKALKRNPLLILEYINIGMFFSLKNKPELSEKYLNAGLFISEKLLDIYDYLYRKKIYDAKHRIKEIGRIILGFYYELGISYLRQKKYEWVRKIIKILKKFYPKYAETYFLAGQYSEAIGKIKKATKELTNALKLCKNRYDVCFNLCQTLIPLYIKEKNYKKAKEIYDFIVEKYPDNTDYFEYYKKVLKKHIKETKK
ncbi:MAG: hypothetical protein N3E50_02980 [Candidatus Goldbacteria bacterium]|nr:hypothetical protein [Candidatus Goldiibacteriota bacterium]